MHVLLSMVTLVGFLASSSSSDEYVDESRGSCDAKRDLMSCAKYQVLTMIVNYTDNSIISDTTPGSIRFIRIDEPEEGDGMFATARFYSSDYEVTKFFKFIVRQMDYFLGHQGLLVALPEGVRIIQDDGDFKADARGKKKKADMLIQLVTLFKVFKIKVLVAVAVAGIFFIKKTLLLAALILPSVLQSLKAHCKPVMIHPHHYEEHVEDYGGYNTNGAWNSGYGNSWIRRR